MLPDRKLLLLLERLVLRLNRLEEGRLKSDRDTQEPGEIGDGGPLDPTAGGLRAKVVSVMASAAAGCCCCC